MITFFLRKTALHEGSVLKIPANLEPTLSQIPDIDKMIEGVSLSKLDQNITSNES